MAKIYVVAETFVKPEERESALPLYRELVAETKKEAGCIAYDVYIDKNDPNHLTFMEEWASQEALDAHMKTPHFTGIFPKIGEKAAKEGAVSMYGKLE